MKLTKLAKTLSLIALFASTSALAGWQLDNDASQVYFISIKKSAIGEIHHFTSVSGMLSDSGEANLDIDLASVETNIGIRNERMQKMLFETNLFPKASIKGKFDANRIRKLRAGDHFTVQQQASLELHGEKQMINTQIRVVKLTSQRVLVSTIKPIILNVGDYKLYQGVEKLKEVAGLPSIASAVPITFSLVFKLEEH